MLDRPSYRTLQWFVAVFALLHNVEEALTMPGCILAVRQRLSGVAPPVVLAAIEDLSWFYIALGVATVAPIAAVVAATMVRPRQVTAQAVVFVQALVLANVVIPHVPASIVLGGYAPGVATAVAINLPYSVYFLRRSVAEGVVSRAWAVLAVVLAVPALVVGLVTLYVIAVSAV